MGKSILIVLYYYRPYISGLSEFAKNLAENLTAIGYRVTVLTTQYKKNLPARELINGVVVIRVPVIAEFGKGVLAPALWFKAITMARKYDYVNFHLPIAEAGISCLFINKEKFIPVYHCDLDLGKRFTQRLVETVSYLFMGMALWRSRKIIVTSIDYFKHSRFSKYLDKAVAIYPPIDDKRFGQVDCKDLQRRLGISGASLKIGFVGRIVSEKGLEYLLAAIDYLSEEMEDFIVIIVGEYENVAGGSVLEELQQRMAKNPDKVLFTGSLEDNDMKKFYSMIDVLVLPSTNPLEAFGMVQVEAMLCGTPVVASDLPGVRVVVREVGFGRLAKVGDAKDLAEKILDICRQNPVLDNEKLEKFRLKNVVREYARIFS